MSISNTHKYVDTDKIEAKGVSAVDVFFEDSSVVTAYLKKHDNRGAGNGKFQEENINQQGKTVR